MKFELKPYNRDISDEELLDDLKKVAKELNRGTLTREAYQQSTIAKFGVNTFTNRFGSWNKALVKADIEISKQINISEEDLLKNIEDVWIKLGREPVLSDLKRPNSKFSELPYYKKFESWRKALDAFIIYISSSTKPENEAKRNDHEIVPTEEVFKHKTKRNISDRLKVQVLMRDGNKCRLCGITVTGDNIHFDHIKPWSKGGETEFDNIQVLCAEHNLAKGNWELPT